MKAATYTGELRMLFAVVAIAAAPLVVSAFASSSPPPPPARKPVAPIVLIQPMVIQMATPRTMRSGAPACGNVTSRVPYQGPQ